jgi:hypothetical protein
MIITNEITLLRKGNFSLKIAVKENIIFFTVLMISFLICLLCNEWKDIQNTLIFQWFCL